MSFEFESVNHGQSDTSDLNIARSHLLKDEEGLSTELSDDELEQVNGGFLPLLIGIGVRIAAPHVIRFAARQVAKQAGMELVRGVSEGLGE
ncbi:class IIb bacteriocin, lactobin A/cerein 7B family [Microcoleus sp. Pol7_A1]|uniref:class IIb bacteriocin, lactobin A/cerein 7B family n=1 Tax=Microcoleus sp. Pol7_A1 TaxID=2818893 RepID=UPI002FD17827